MKSNKYAKVKFGKKFTHGRVEYDNKGYFEAGVITKKIRKQFEGKIPQCDEVYLKIKEGGKDGDFQYFVLTVDEACAIAMILNETVWHTMLHTVRKV